MNDDLAEEPPLPDVPLKPGNLWADVNDVISAFIRLEREAAPLVLWPEWIVPLLATHRVDGPALLGMSLEDLLDVFHMSDPIHVRNFSDAVERLRCAALRHMMFIDAACDRRQSSAATEATTCCEGVVDETEPIQMPREATPRSSVDSDEELPHIDTFSFVETALQKHGFRPAPADGMVGDPSTTLLSEYHVRRPAKEASLLVLKTFNPRRLDPRCILPLSSAGCV